jgi:hypothetical protein
MALPGQFNIKYKTRIYLQRAIQQEIMKQGFVETQGTMHDSIRISAATGDLNNLYVEITCIYYYMFLDKGAELWNGGIIRPHYMTKNAFASANGKKFVDLAIADYLEWMNKKYPILDVATIKVTPKNIKMNIKYNLFGDDTYGWKGMYDYETDWYSWA